MLSELGCEKDRCLYIGDSNVDTATAQNAGVEFCGVEWGFRGREELEKAGAKMIVSKPEQITEIVLA